MIGTLSELAETQAELDAWTHELNSFQVLPLRNSFVYNLYLDRFAPSFDCSWRTV